MLDSFLLLLFTFFCWAFVIIGGLTLLAIKLGWLPGVEEQWQEIKRLKIYVVFSTVGGISSYLELIGQTAQPILLVPLVIGSILGIVSGILIMKKVWRQNGHEEESGKETS